MWNRRHFMLATSAAALSSGRPGLLHALQAAARTLQKLNLASIDRARILAAADRYLHELPVTITASQSPRSAGGLHDFFSEGDYWWPDPKNPGGPYIRRDGFSNPANPKSKPGNKGLNENYGREVMELHTVGVNGGYSQADVTALSAILTGWGVDNPGKAGGFLFDPNRHEPGPKQWFGHTIASSGMNEGIQALTILAASPQTAHFISNLIAQRFVADDPPPALVDRMAATYLASDGDIKEVLRTLVASPEFNSRRYFRNKVKTPIEFIASAFRTTATDPQNPGALVNELKQMGMPLYYALPPTGYYLTADQWMNSAALVERLNFAYQLTNNKFSNQQFDAAHVLAIGLRSEPATPASSGTDTALLVLENALIGVTASAQTNDLIHKQMEQQPAATPTDTLNLITALILGSPDFQFR